MSQKAVSFIHDILTEVLTDWSEPPHFHFNEALFRPFERIMQLELCDEDVQDQVSVTRAAASSSSSPVLVFGEREAGTVLWFARCLPKQVTKRGSTVWPGSPVTGETETDLENLAGLIYSFSRSHH